MSFNSSESDRIDDWYRKSTFKIVDVRILFNSFHFEITLRTHLIKFLRCWISKTSLWMNRSQQEVFATSYYRNNLMQCILINTKTAFNRGMKVYNTKF